MGPLSLEGRSPESGEAMYLLGVMLIIQSLCQLGITYRQQETLYIRYNYVTVEY